MVKNIGTVERVLRTVAGAGMVAAGFSGAVKGPWRYALPACGAVQLLEGVTGYSFLYGVLDVSTKDS